MTHPTKCPRYSKLPRCSSKIQLFVRFRYENVTNDRELPISRIIWPCDKLIQVFRWNQIVEGEIPNSLSQFTEQAICNFVRRMHRGLKCVDLPSVILVDEVKKRLGWDINGTKKGSWSRHS
jgi:hypothetical protein